MKKLNSFLYLLALLKFVLPFLLQNSIYEPHRDEFLYLAEGKHPAWGFMEVPPLLSVFAWINFHLGNGIFWIKFWPSLFGALNLVLVGRMILSLGAGFFSMFLLFCCFIFSAYIRVNFLFQPNFLEIFFYTWIAFGLIRYIQTSKNKWLYLTAVGAGFGLLSKYSVSFYLISLIPALLLTNQRKIFLNKHFYYAAGLTVLIFLPNIIWQKMHEFPVVYHMRELSAFQLQYISPSSFLLEQLLMFFPCFFVWVTGFFYLLLNRRLRSFVFLCWAYLCVIAILLWFHGKGYYSLGLYPVLLGFGSLAIENWAVRSRYFLRYVILAIVLLLGIDFTFIGLPLMKPEKLASFYEKRNARRTGFLKWEDQQDHPLPQDFADMLGWEEMAQKTSTAYYSLDSAQRANTIIFCDNYGMAGAVNYYSRKYKLPEAYSDNASFLYWIPDSIQYQNFVLLTDDRQEMQHHFVKEFAGAKLWGTITEPYARENGTQIILLTGASDQFRKDFNDKILADKQKTRR
jgi:4-amino-4-deoxy-L-arabinose transferase-like glycosyltransferase